MEWMASTSRLSAGAIDDTVLPRDLSVTWAGMPTLPAGGAVIADARPYE